LAIIPLFPAQRGSSRSRAAGCIDNFNQGPKAMKMRACNERFAKLTAVAKAGGRHKSGERVVAINFDLRDTPTVL
jgi:hypothetical protein